MVVIILAGLRKQGWGAIKPGPGPSVTDGRPMHHLFIPTPRCRNAAMVAVTLTQCSGSVTGSAAVCAYATELSILMSAAVVDMPAGFSEYLEQVSAALMKGAYSTMGARMM